MSTENYDILRVVKRCITRNKLFDKKSKIIAAVSGGIDSMTLIEVLLALRKEYAITLAVAHVNYGLRGKESEGDEQLVRDYAGSKGLPIYAKKVNPDDPAVRTTGSLQQWARDLRYLFFEEMRVKHGFDFIATGHTADDNAETVFLNLLRGAGPEGLRGIPAKRDSIIRPLIYISRNAIETYAGSMNIPFRVDTSNRSDRYARNVVRNHVFPLIQSKLRENVKDSINRTSEIIRSIDDYIREEAKRQSTGMVQKTGDREYFIEKKPLKSLHPVIAGYVIRDTATRLCGMPISFIVTKRIQWLIDSPAGVSVVITPEYRADSESSGIRLLENKDPEKFIAPIELNEEYRFSDFTFKSSFTTPDQVSFDNNKNIEYVDAGKIEKPIILRYWFEGDRIQPLGMHTMKKVSDIFIDAKVPRSYKHRIPLLTTLKDIIWICGIQIDDRFKVTDNTQHILKIQYIPHAGR